MSTSLKDLIKYKRTYENYKLDSFYYSSCAGMDGGNHNIEVFPKQKKIIYTDKELEDKKEKIKKYKLSNEDISYFISFIDNYNLPEWGKTPLEDIEVLDEPSKSLTFVYTREDGYKEFYNVDTDIDIEREARLLFNDFINKMKSYKK